MDDHGYHELLKVTDPFLTGLYEGEFEDIGIENHFFPITTTFVNNMQRVAWIATLPGWLVSMSHISQFSADAATLKLTGTLSLDDNNFDKLPQPKSFKEESDKFLAMGLRGENIRQLIYGYETGNASKTTIDQMGVRNFLHHINHSGMVHTSEVMHALFSSLLIGSWSAYETLCGQLLVDAIGYHPDPLCLLSGKKDRITNTAQDIKSKNAKANKERVSDSFDSDQHHEKEQKLSMKQIRSAMGGDFKSVPHMGEMLRNTKLIEFTSLRAIRRSYSLAFPDDVNGHTPQSIDDCLVDNDLDALSLIRNLLVHHSGRADVTYIRDRPGVTSAPFMELNQSIKLNGVLLGRLIDCASKRGVQLIKAVQSWIACEKSRNATK